MQMMQKITRRHALKLITAASATAALSPVLHARARYPWPPEPDVDVDEAPDTWEWMGRAIYPITFYERPAISATRLNRRSQDQAFLILGEVRAPYTAHNDLWYMTHLGYVPSAWVQPIQVYPPQPFVRNAGEWGLWGQVSQVYTTAYAEPSLQARQVYRLYAGTVYHVMETFEDDHGTGWYKIYDDFPPRDPSHQWVLARDVRRVLGAEMSPIHPFVGNKHIEVDLGKQTLTCHEGDQVVFTTRTASGIAADGTGTPTGKVAVMLKQASRHMCNTPYPGGPPLVGEHFDLPGIPWNTFFDMEGTAIHGTYWHNDFGVQRSHGCLNVSFEAARWVYRWVHPIGGYENAYIRSDNGKVGTPINIF